jgi:hypothetical protein
MAISETKWDRRESNINNGDLSHFDEAHSRNKLFCIKRLKRKAIGDAKTVRLVF